MNIFVFWGGFLFALACAISAVVGGTIGVRNDVSKTQKSQVLSDESLSTETSELVTDSLPIYARLEPGRKKKFKRSLEATTKVYSPGLETDTDDPGGISYTLEELKGMKPGPGVQWRKEMPAVVQNKSPDLRKKRQMAGSVHKLNSLDDNHSKGPVVNISVNVKTHKTTTDLNLNTSQAGDEKQRPYNAVPDQMEKKPEKTMAKNTQMGDHQTRSKLSVDDNIFPLDEISESRTADGNTDVLKSTAENATSVKDQMTFKTDHQDRRKTNLTQLSRTRMDKSLKGSHVDQARQKGVLGVKEDVFEITSGSNGKERSQDVHPKQLNPLGATGQFLDRVNQRVRRSDDIWGVDESQDKNEQITFPLRDSDPEGQPGTALEQPENNGFRRDEDHEKRALPSEDSDTEELQSDVALEQLTQSLQHMKSELDNGDHSRRLRTRAADPDPDTAKKSLNKEIINLMKEMENRPDNWLENELKLIESESRALKQKASQLHHKLSRVNDEQQKSEPYAAEDKEAPSTYRDRSMRRKHGNSHEHIDMRVKIHRGDPRMHLLNNMLRNEPVREDTPSNYYSDLRSSGAHTRRSNVGPVLERIQGDLSELRRYLNGDDQDKASARNYLRLADLQHHRHISWPASRNDRYYYPASSGYYYDNVYTGRYKREGRADETKSLEHQSKSHVLKPPVLKNTTAGYGQQPRRRRDAEVRTDNIPDSVRQQQQQSYRDYVLQLARKFGQRKLKTLSKTTNLKDNILPFNNRDDNGYMTKRGRNNNGRTPSLDRIYQYDTDKDENVVQEWLYGTGGKRNKSVNVNSNPGQRVRALKLPIRNISAQVLNNQHLGEFLKHFTPGRAPQVQKISHGGGYGQNQPNFERPLFGYESPSPEGLNNQNPSHKLSDNQSPSGELFRYQNPSRFSHYGYAQLRRPYSTQVGLARGSQGRGQRNDVEVKRLRLRLPNEATPGNQTINMRVGIHLQKQLYGHPLPTTKVSRFNPERAYEEPAKVLPYGKETVFPAVNNGFNFGSGRRNHLEHFRPNVSTPDPGQYRLVDNHHAAAKRPVLSSIEKDIMRLLNGGFSGQPTHGINQQRPSVTRNKPSHQPRFRRPLYRNNHVIDPQKPSMRSYYVQQKWKILRGQRPNHNQAVHTKYAYPFSIPKLKFNVTRHASGDGATWMTRHGGNLALTPLVRLRTSKMGGQRHWAPLPRDELEKIILATNIQPTQWKPASLTSYINFPNHGKVSSNTARNWAGMHTDHGKGQNYQSFLNINPVYPDHFYQNSLNTGNLDLEDFRLLPDEAYSKLVAQIMAFPFDLLGKRRRRNSYSSEESVVDDVLGRRHWHDKDATQVPTTEDEPTQRRLCKTHMVQEHMTENVPEERQRRGIFKAQQPATEEEKALKDKFLTLLREFPISEAEKRLEDKVQAAEEADRRSGDVGQAILQMNKEPKHPFIDAEDAGDLFVERHRLPYEKKGKNRPLWSRKKADKAKALSTRRFKKRHKRLAPTPKRSTLNQMPQEEGLNQNTTMGLPEDGHTERPPQANTIRNPIADVLDNENIYDNELLRHNNKLPSYKIEKPAVTETEGMSTTVRYQTVEVENGPDTFKDLISVLHSSDKQLSGRQGLSSDDSVSQLEFGRAPVNRHLGNLNNYGSDRVDSLRPSIGKDSQIGEIDDDDKNASRGVQGTNSGRDNVQQNVKPKTEFSDNYESNNKNSNSNTDFVDFKKKFLGHRDPNQKARDYFDGNEDEDEYDDDIRGYGLDEDEDTDNKTAFQRYQEEDEDEDDDDESEEEEVAGTDEDDDDEPVDWKENGIEVKDKGHRVEPKENFAFIEKDPNIKADYAWAEWGECTVTCGVGQRFRINKCGVVPCSGIQASTEVEACSLQAKCPTTPEPQPSDNEKDLEPTGLEQEQNTTERTDQITEPTKSARQDTYTKTTSTFSASTDLSA